jgi:hypothetical protein
VKWKRDELEGFDPPTAETLFTPYRHPLPFLDAHQIGV